MKNTIEQLHLAAQYLAAIGICFVDKETDDSHTNLEWDSANSRLITHSFGVSKNQVAFAFFRAKIVWLQNGEIKAELDLEKSTHKNNIEWLKKQAINNNIEKEFVYRFHYDLPYKTISYDFIFSFDRENTIEIANRFSIANEVFQEFLKMNQLTSPIRVWPHHFDLGIYASLGNASDALFLGAGLAIPDTLVNDMYYYASGWKDGSAVITADYSGLETGQWRSDWNGATLPSSNVVQKNAIVFLNGVIKKLLENV